MTDLVPLLLDTDSECTGGEVSVETFSPSLAGPTTLNADADQKPHRIAVKVDPTRFFAHYFGVVGG